MASRGERAPIHTLFLVLVGLTGWVLLATRLPHSAHLPSLTSTLLFLAVIVGARLLAVPLLSSEGDAEVSLDAAIFMVAAACLGGEVTALGMAALVGLDRLLRSPSSPSLPARLDRWRRWGTALYVSGLSGGLLSVLSFHFLDVDAKGRPSAWLVPVLGMTFLVSYYLVQTIQLRLAGHSWRMAIQRNALGAVAEATLLPLGAIIATNWDEQHPMPFVLLGGTYLLVNFGFYRMAQLATALRRRVVELETLNRSAHALSASLEASHVLSALLHETARALPRSVRLEALIRQVDAPGAAHVPQLPHLPHLIERYIHLPGRGSEPASAWREAANDATAELVLKEPLLEVEGAGKRRARLAVPIVIYGETVGVLSAESREAGSFGPNELRLLEAIAGQAAAAVENARLYALANVDGLTGLYCRRYFDVRIAEEIERARRFATSFALVLLDIDDFKQLNDTYGHLVGDRALREVAMVTAGQLRGVDLAARYGGEELAFLLPRTSLADAHAVADRIRQSLAAHRFVEAGRTVPITASLGVSGWAEANGGDAISLVQRADSALYRAKAAGKNRVEIELTNFELTPALAPVRRRHAESASG